ncbi:MAG: N-acetylglucosamine kinase [Flavobacteriaceae bacterium]|nr:N-acetylglucosamine kinase [Flavobacteriaceae bacterium]|tara:strand:- start:355 stop:1215 length:861 start_codon:yes stop_codon:yes gene_type:complete
MILVVDSGSTKTDWIGIDDSGSILFSTQTLGLNPQVLSSAIINERIINNYDLYQNRKKISKLFFYGAGCGVASSINRIKKIFNEIFENAHTDIKEDTYAAVYSVSKINKPSIVCILGTGSNCTYFDGLNIIQRVTSLGYILMDEASGNFYGKQLLRSYYFNEMPKNYAKEFEKEFKLDPDTIKENLYRKENPNTYLATFAKFIIDRKDHPLMQEIIVSGLDRFIKHQILQFDNCKEIPIHFVGSIAYYIKNEIKNTLLAHGLTMGNVIQRPIDGLLIYHKSLLNKV